MGISLVIIGYYRDIPLAFSLERMVCPPLLWKNFRYSILFFFVISFLGG